MITSFHSRSSRTIQVLRTPPRPAQAAAGASGRAAGLSQMLELAGACSMIAFFLVLALFG